ncbi:uncharacterized protein LOC129946254 [Eupeodes corollae]|uniref:uncharacterized protein LOC129946254 n=1 Tax=Eupeodes corollae TaxID=290404 RepID=UPI0024935B47|nr:uncharacterized protein LOC129946254 [Eupeodes corollae]
MAFSIVTLVLVIIFLIDYTNGKCGDCQDNFVACQSLTTFSLCIDDKSNDDEILECPQGRLCTDKPDICVENTNSSFQASCGQGCEVCNSHDKVFSCVGRSEVAFCFGEDLPFYSVIARCPKGYVCDLSSRAICVKKDYSEGSCDKDYKDSTSDLPIIDVATPSSVSSSPLIRDAQTFCRENAMEGTFAAEGDLTCKKYYICQALSNGSKFMGYSYYCSGSDYFDPVKRFCVADKPKSC